MCPVTALIAIAYMMARGAGPWYGYDSTPTGAAVFVASYWWTQPDPTPEARYAFSLEDLRRPAVQRIVLSKKPLAQFSCAGGLGLVLY